MEREAPRHRNARCSNESVYRAFEVARETKAKSQRPSPDRSPALGSGTAAPCKAQRGLRDPSDMLSRRLRRCEQWLQRLQNFLLETCLVSFSCKAPAPETSSTTRVTRSVSERTVLHRHLCLPRSSSILGPNPVDGGGHVQSRPDMNREQSLKVYLEK